MAWWGDLKDITQYAGFVKYIGDDRGAVKMVNFAGCTLTAMGQNFVGKAPLQTKDTETRVVEICIQFSDQKWFQINAPDCKAMIDDIGLTAGRDAKAFTDKKDLALQRGYDLKTLLRRELVTTLNKVNKLIERLWENFNSEAGGTKEGAENLREENLKKKAEAAEELRELRKHEKEKVNKHKYGNYVLYTNMIDDEHLLLISSDFSKAIDSGYLDTARKYSTQATKQSEGLYRQADGNLTEFEQHKGPCTVADFRDALKALRATRSAVMVDKGTIDKKKVAKGGHDDDELRAQLSLLGEFRKEHKELLKKASEGQFWITAEAADGDPLLVITKDWKKPVGGTDKLDRVKKDTATAVATGKWFYDPSNNYAFLYEFTTGNLHANVMNTALKAARVTGSANPVTGIDKVKKDKLGK